jgi:hypothetical protein
MKTIMLAAAAALSLGIGSAYADGGEGPTANTFFTALPGVVAQAQVQQAPSALAANVSGAPVNTYATTAHSAGTWLFQANQNSGSNS